MFINLVELYGDYMVRVVVYAFDATITSKWMYTIQLMCYGNCRD